jgi:hypothetical protein
MWKKLKRKMQLRRKCAMMKLCSKLLLITKDEHVEGLFITVAGILEMSGNIVVHKRIPADISSFDVVVVDHAEAKRESTPDNAIVILRDSKIGSLTDKYSRFIFNYDDRREIFISFFVLDKVARTADESIQYGDCTMDFSNEKFYFKGKELYVTKKETEYLRKRFIECTNVSSMRHLLFNMRKRFGRDFLTVEDCLC